MNKMTAKKPEKKVIHLPSGDVKVKPLVVKTNIQHVLDVMQKVARRDDPIR